jgi:hypothetical protein
MPPEKPAAPTAKRHDWSIPTVLSLILGAVGALTIIELKPQIVVPPQEAIEKSQPFSVPFRIENSGYLSFHVNRVLCYVDKIQAGGITLGHGSTHEPDWDNFDLERGEGKTVFCRIIHSGNVPNTADIAIVLDERPFRRFPRSFRRYFRFTGAYVDNWQWLAQPSAPIQKDIDRQIDAPN